ncbi:MAG: triose-phosphate isomerase [Thermoplasmata archaeon]
MFLLNLKSYPGALGTGAERIGRKLQSLARELNVPCAIAPAPGDLGRLANALDLPVLAQHVDPLDPGAFTGFNVPEAVRLQEGRGSLVNHSEHRVPPRQVGKTVRMLNALGLVAVVCARDARDAGRLARFRPPYLAVEPPELIGSGRSVSKVRPEVVSDTVRSVRKVAPRCHVLCGAGIVDRTDVRRALELGSEGVLVASAVARASSPTTAMRELLGGFPRS